MTGLKRHQVPEGLTNGEYRIRRVAGGPRDRWLLEVDESGSQRHRRGVPTVSSYATLRGAKEAAHRANRERLRRDRVIGHAVVSVAAFIVSATVLPFMGSLIAFAIAIVAFYVGLRSLTFAVSIRLGDAWGWTRDGGLTAPPRLSDRIVLRGMVWLRRRTEAAVDVPTAGAVHVLHPEPPE